MDNTKRTLVALVGNPNSGKSTVFTALARIRQRVGNYPGVTVEKKTGDMMVGDQRITLIDLPGTYSLVPNSIDERVAVDILHGRSPSSTPPDAILCILDASNLRRNLYLASQVLELGIPTILILNMIDVACRRGIGIDAELLAKRLGVPVVVTQANRGMGIDAIRELLGRHDQLVSSSIRLNTREADARYAWIDGILNGVVQTNSRPSTDRSDRMDRFFLHKIWGSLFFFIVMALVFQAVYAWAEPMIHAVDTCVSWVGNLVALALPDGILQSLVCDGILAGVGAVLTFLPQILLLFFFIAVLEDCGYMARAACLMDQWMSRVGLSGKSFIPLLASFACAVPGIMATRVIENRRDRLVTMLIAPLMCCSARLPVYTLLIGAFIPKHHYLGNWIGLQGITLVSLYVLGMLAAVIVAIVLKKTLLRGETPSFIMELPAYKRPSIKLVLYRILEQGWEFIHQAGTLILAVTILVWAAAYFPRDVKIEETYQRELHSLAILDCTESAEHDPSIDAAAIARRQKEIHNLFRAAQMQQSYLGRAGQWIEPVVRPLGWDWRIGCSVIASFPARESVISALGVIYHLGEEQDESSPTLRERLRQATWNGSNRPVFTVPVALSIMVFFALCAQCVATLVVIRNETKSWRWPAFTFAYMTILAYVAALITYQVGTHWFS
ncbi:MAG: ferrous iron transporter B [Pirellulales bacterium]|nr:ferrous iron transporter B [Pirellulales bacterium]